MRKLNLIILALLLTAQAGCVSVAAYQKVYLYDENMALEARKIEVYESNIEAYREGASGGNGGKTGGGCGCN